MKSFSIAICVVGLLVGFSTLSHADTYKFHEIWDPGNAQQIDVNGNQPKVWEKLYFPDTLSTSVSPYSITYSGLPTGQNKFEYDDLIAVNSGFTLDVFKITVNGHGNSYKNDPIDFFLDFNRDHSAYFESTETDYGKIAGRQVDENVPFTLVMDVKKGEFLYGINGATPAFSSYLDSNVNPSLFVNRDKFYLGIGCHFYLDDISVDVIFSKPGFTPPLVPEPSTLLLLGMPLIGIAVWRIRKS